MYHPFAMMHAIKRDGKRQKSLTNAQIVEVVACISLGKYGIVSIP